MKKYFILSVLALVAMSAFAQSRIDMRSESKAEITRSDFTSLNAVFSYGAIESAEVSTTRGIFSEIAIEGTYPSGEIGTPQLPASHQLLAVPFGATPSVNIISYTTTDYCLSDYGIKTLLPHQPSIRKDQRPEDVEFVYEASSYQTRSLATAPEATIEVQGTLRGIRIGSLVVNPVSYNPTSNTLRVFNDIELEVRFEGADLAETERMLLSTYSPYFDIVYQQMFNYRQILDVYTDHPDLMAYPVHMIVIAPQNYTTALQPWVNWKIQKGFDVNVYTTSQTGTSYSAIRSYVQNLYNTGVSQGKTPTFLILVGDVAQIPATTGSSSEKVTDLYYGSVDGDYFPDMFYSRMSAENTTQLTSIINKILQYEQYTMADPSYLNKVLLIAGQDDYWNPVVAQPTINYATTYYYNTAHGFSNVYAYLNSYSGCYNNLSTGVGFANYTAHGSETGWSGPAFSNSNVNSLTNTNKYFLAMGNCCLTGNFGYSSACFGEAMIRAENKGAYSYIGSCPVTYWYEDFYFGVGAHNTHGGPTPSYAGSSTGCYDGIWMDDTYNTVSSMVFLGNLAVCYAHTGGYQTHSSPLYYWQAYHVLGDGSIMPYRVNPTANNVSHSTTFPAGATSFTVAAEAGSYVGISQNNVLKGAALVPTSGIVNVPVTPVTSGQVKIVVTKPQRQPYIRTLNVAGGTVTHTVTIQADPAEGGTVAFGNKGQREDITYDFEADFAAQQILYWTVIDADGDGYGWYIRPTGLESLGHNGSQGFVTSASYQEVPLTPDNYLVSPQGQYSSISFWACAQDAAWPQEHFGVAVSTTNGTSPSAFTTIQEWDMTAKRTGNRRERGTNELGTYYEYTVDLSAYAGQDIYVAIRHFNCTDWFRLNVDDITLSTVAVATPITAIYDHGTSCTVTATPNTGYIFNNWTENGSVVSSSANYTFTVNGNRNLVANFSAGQVQQYTVNISSNPSNGGMVAFNQGDQEEITYDFDDQTMMNWTSVDGDNDGYGWVSSADPGQYYNAGVNLAGTGHNASQGYVISGSWSNSATIALTPNNYLVSPSKDTYSHIRFYACAQDANYAAEHFGVAVSTTTATASAFTTIQEWTLTAKGERHDAPRGTRDQGVWYEFNADLSAYAGQEIWVAIRHFNCTDQFILSVDDITLTSVGGSSSGSAIFNQGESCTVTATAYPNYTFSNWTENGTVVSSSASYTFTVNGNRNLVANFTSSQPPQPEQYNITLTANPVEGGTVNGGGTFNQGTSCTVTATPNTGYNFVNWTENGSVVSSNANYTFTVNSNRNLVANFTTSQPPQPEQYTITLTANPVEGGTVNGGGTFNQGTSCTVTATPNTGYNFVNWTENGSVVSSNTNYTFTVNGNRNLVANFSAGQVQQYTVNISSNPTNGGMVTFNQGNQEEITYDFEDQTMMNWTSIDGDNDGYGWVSSANPGQYHNAGINLAGSGHNASQGYVLSGSWSNPAAIALTPNNYLVSPSKDTYSHIRFYACAQDANYAAEHFGVAVSTTTATASAFTTIQEWTLTAKGERHGGPRGTREQGVWYEFEADLSAYVGQEIWVAIRHFNCTDQFILNVDDITLTIRDVGSSSGSAIFNQGESCTVTATAYPNYTFSNWSENGIAVSINASYTFTVNGNRDLVANFEQITFTITASAGEFGSITPAGDITVVYGGSQHFEMTPDYDCEVLEVLVDGTSVGAVTEYTFEEVTSDHTIHVTFNQTLGTDETEAQALVVYPNPTSGQFKLTNHDFKEVRVYNTLGVMVLSLNSNGSEDVEIDLSGQPNGIYFLQVSDNHQSITKRIVKMN